MRNINSFTLTGNVIRINPISNGAIFVLGNRRDYKKEDEWIEVNNYISVITFSKVNFEVGDSVTVSGEITTRKDDAGHTVMGLRADIIEVRGNTSKTESEPKQSSKKQPTKSKPKPVDEDDDEDLFG